ncbi:universal stress protein [Streptomyces mangrovisoli]|uniref:UspA domain-containing protein n=1 Tax=Streptomyces mangrovisoli TaxID=1428628 RepID=A0A1J4P1N6_9ACTN|nr:universal stress protein [Streptomyces mangrovisoli]OIJ68671.1 hypothetical protein WN71_006450 [Streptomyces mangrovisoli]
MERMVIARVDGSALGRTAAHWAAREALRRRLPLRVAQVAPRGTHVAPRAAATECGTDGAHTADCLVAELAARHPLLTVRSIRLTGTAAPGLSALTALTARAELLVLGLDGDAGARTRAEVAAASVCPVVLVPPPPAGSDRWTGRVVVAVDARRPSAEALAFAFAAARRHRARLHAVHAWTLPAHCAERPLPVLEADRATWEDQEVQLLSDALRPWRERYPDVEVLADVRLLGRAEALGRSAEGARLVVVGRSQVAPAPRSVPADVPCPLAVVP